MISRLCVVCLLVTCFVDKISAQQELNNQQECIDGPSTWYTGTRNVTSSGITCQRWDVNYPQKPKQTPRDGGHHNFCRNPDGDLRGTWCYTTDPTKRWEYCNITKCPDDSIVVWTNHDSKNGGAHILSVKADPEIVKQQTDTAGIFNVAVLVASNQTKTEFWALTADYNRQMIFFTDYMSEYIGVRYLEHGLTVQYLSGMAHGIENMAYDWRTGNLYWTDSEFKWIMAVDRTFTFYTPVYRTNGDPPYAIALHAKQRKLFFSIYQTTGSMIVTTDLAGQGKRILFQNPYVYDVTGLTIDYTDDRLYWTDFTGYGGMVVSSKLDGTNKTQHHYRGGAIYWGITAYLDYLYVTDVHARYSTTGDKHYSVWVINKQPHLDNVFRYTLEGKPRGISIISKNEDRSFDVVPSLGECINQPACDHICLPRINATRECRCSLGYKKVGDTRCVANVTQDNFLLVADSGQGKVFQIPFNITSPDQYSVVPLRNTKKISNIAFDAKTRNVLWSDKRIQSIKKSGMDGSRVYTLTDNEHALSMAVDHRQGNVYYVDEDTQTISVMTNDGSRTRELHEAGNITSSNIKKVALDPKNNMLYWTDAGPSDGKGSVWRMMLDGSKKEAVYTNLNSPQGITIDYQRNSLFVCEAKTAMVYEKKLKSLKTISNTSHLTAQQFDLAGHITRLSFFIGDIAVRTNVLFFVDTKTNKVESIDLTSGPASLKQFGPAEFYRATSLAVYSSTYYTTYLQPIADPCAIRTRACSDICVPSSPTTSRCLCEKGSIKLGTACYKTSTGNPPTYQEGSCSIDKTYSLLPCFEAAEVTWSDPIWTDDVTPQSSLTLTRPPWKSPANFTVGNYVFSYTATDQNKNTARCTFNIRVTATSCGNPPMMPTDLMISGRSPCNHNYGAEYVVKCVDETMEMAFQNTTSDTFTNVCMKDGNWIIKNFASARCQPKPATATTTSTPTVTTSTPKTTTTGTDKQQPNTKKIHTLSTQVTESNTKALPDDNPVASAGTAGLKPGPIAAIAVMAILLVIIIVAVIIVTIRNRPAWKVARFTIPIIWKRKTEETPPSENPYSVMS